ncbi:RNA-binding protein Rnp24 [Schizosaccharomyces japonicus yFS275]|uniref:RNA-binding protein Rnp24 n=1 Tax=Schizosaccharomyces japonicus (strain yFS275 / FY16936) TaxID=402676 RepID=B6JYI9_SCHJY|nr:RNA-binding protein Rnp24 [Schizosaccharomyces japonicus yFS275]EEB06607.1 RNA-binding protein Rnp24 [Schizosaccharomyces japonicus yFS275]
MSKDHSEHAEDDDSSRSRKESVSDNELPQNAEDAPSDTENKVSKDSKHHKSKHHASSKHSKGDEEELLEIDVSQPVPPSRKLRRKLRKAGKIDKDGNWTEEALKEAKKKEAKRLRRLEKKLGEKDTDEDAEKGPKGSSAPNKPATKFGIWIGNLSFLTTVDILKEFFVRETAAIAAEQGGNGLQAEQIVRVHMPMNKIRKNQNRGFAYVDFDSEESLGLALACSEHALNGRNVLIKSSTDYTGRPDKVTVSKTEKIAARPANPPSSTLFVGNLPFDATKETLSEYFGDAGRIRRVRLMTFEDTGKCKGFGFVDFFDVETAQRAMAMSHDTWRLEYGQDRSKRVRPARAARTNNSGDYGDGADETGSGEADSYERPVKRSRKVDPRSIRPGAALARAARATAAIVKPQGTKIKFD